MKELNKVTVHLVASFLLFFATNSTKLSACEDPHFRYSVESDSEGRQLLIWLDCNQQSRVLKSAVIGVDGVLSEPLSISAPDQICYFPQLKLSSEGDAAVIWLASDSTRPTFALYAALLPKKGNWSKPVCLSVSPEEVLASTAHLCLSDNRMNVFWESRTYYNSPTNPDELLYREEFRTASGTLQDGWTSAKTLANFR